MLQNRFWWPTLRRDIIVHVNRCQVCNTQKPSRHLPAGLLHPLPIPECPWSHIAIDFITDLPNSYGHNTILTVVDRFSKACCLIPLPKLPTALETAELMCNEVFRYYGLPEDILSDRGPQFLWSAFKALEINVSLTSGYHPQSNGQAERLNQELVRFLRSYCSKNQLDWSRYLMWAEYAQNSLQKPATRLTPFQCILGFQPPLFPWSGKPTNVPSVPSVNDWIQRSEETWDQAHKHLRQAVRRQQTQADRHRRQNPEYHAGQWVWLSTRDLRLRLPCRKLSPRYMGPYQIRRQITPVSFELALPNHFHVSPTFHVSLLKPADGPEEGSEEPPEEIWRVRRYTRSENFLIPGTEGALSSTWSTGRVTVRRRGLGSTQMIFWTPAWWRISTETTRKDRAQDHAVDPGANHLLASGAARRGGGGGALLQRTSLWLPLRAIRGNLLPSISLHHLSLITRPTCSTLPGLFNQLARVASLRSLVLPR